VSDGLAAHGQVELCFTVKREAGEAEHAFPRMLFDLFRIIEDCAANGQIVTEGGFTRLNPAMPGLVRDDFHGVMYTSGQRLAGVEAREPFLTAIALTGPETQVAEQFGMVRVMALLGEHYRFFPTAPWIDRNRPEIAHPESAATSILNQLPRFRVSGVRARYETPQSVIGEPGTKVVLTMTHGAAKTLLEGFRHLGSDIGVALLLELDTEADAIFVWHPGQAGAFVIVKPDTHGRRVAGNFVAISNGAKTDGSSVIEDGFGLMLTRETWKRFHAAIERRSLFELSGASDGFSLAWAAEN
jgi:hypothetical protein